jgi:hypothetical protein
MFINGHFHALEVAHFKGGLWGVSTGSMQLSEGGGWTTSSDPFGSLAPRAFKSREAAKAWIDGYRFVLDRMVELATPGTV